MHLNYTNGDKSVRRETSAMLRGRPFVPLPAALFSLPRSRGIMQHGAPSEAYGELRDRFALLRM